MGREGAVTLVPAALLVRVARVVVVRLVLQTLEVVASSVGRKACLGPEGPTRALPMAVVRRPKEARAAVTWPRSATRGLTPVEAIAAVALAGALAVPVPVAVPFVVVLGPSEAGKGPSLAGVPVPAARRATPSVLRSAPRPRRVIASQVEDGLGVQEPPIAPVPETPVVLVPVAPTTAAATPRLPATGAAVVQASSLRQVA